MRRIRRVNEDGCDKQGVMVETTTTYIYDNIPSQTLHKEVVITAYIDDKQIEAEYALGMSSVVEQETTVQKINSARAKVDNSDTQHDEVQEYKNILPYIVRWMSSLTLNHRRKYLRTLCYLQFMPPRN